MDQLLSKHLQNHYVCVTMHHSYLCQQYAVQRLLSLLLVLLDVSILMHAKYLGVSDEGAVCVCNSQTHHALLRSEHSRHLHQTNHTLHVP
jgi:hypothetical protein